MIPKPHLQQRPFFAELSQSRGHLNLATLTLTGLMLQRNLVEL